MEQNWEQLLRDFRESYVSIGREVLWSNLVEFLVPLNKLRLIEVGLNETYRKVRVSEKLSEHFAFRIV
jgi:hypothetical protein